MLNESAFETNADDNIYDETLETRAVYFSMRRTQELEKKAEIEIRKHRPPATCYSMYMSIFVQYKF